MIWAGLGLPWSLRNLQSSYSLFILCLKTQIFDAASDFWTHCLCKLLLLLLIFCTYNTDSWKSVKHPQRDPELLMWSTGSGFMYIYVCLLYRNDVTHSSIVSLGDNDERTDGEVKGQQKPISQPHTAHAKLQGFLGNMSTLLCSYEQKMSDCCKLVPNNMKCMGWVRGVNKIIIQSTLNIYS